MGSVIRLALAAWMLLVMARASEGQLSMPEASRVSLSSVCFDPATERSYAPPQALPFAHPAMRVAVFHPATPSPPTGYPTLLWCPQGGYLEVSATGVVQGAPALYERICFGPNQDHNFLWRLLDRGYCLVLVGIVGIDSTGLEDRSGVSYSPFYRLWFDDPMDERTSEEAEALDLHWSEKNFAWARAFISRHALELQIDDDRVIAGGISSGAAVAAFVALGPDRAVVSAPQLRLSTRCAGFLGIEPPAWSLAWGHGLSGFGQHWRKANTQEPAWTIGEADAEEVAESSPSRGIRTCGSFAAETPAFIAYDECTASIDDARGPSLLCSLQGAIGDPSLLDALVGACPCPYGDELHDYWNGLILREDLLSVGNPNVELHLDLGAWSNLVACLSVHDPDEELIRRLEPTALFTGASSGSALGSVELQEAILDWLDGLSGSL